MTIDKGAGETRVAVRAVKFERVAIVKGRSVCNSQSVKDHSQVSLVLLGSSETSCNFVSNWVNGLKRGNLLISVIWSPLIVS